VSEERWAPIAEWEGFYAVSTEGRIRSEARIVSRSDGSQQSVRERVLKLGVHSGGYLSVVLCRDGIPRSVFVHRIVLQAFVGPCPRGMESRHLDGDKANPRLGNLAWGTPVENAADRARHGRQVSGERVGNSKLTRVAVDRIRLDGRAHTKIAADFGVSQTMISRIKRGAAWA
jgi:hypothetical protein